MTDMEGRCRHCGCSVPRGYWGCKACAELPYKKQSWKFPLDKNSDFPKKEQA